MSSRGLNRTQRAPTVNCWRERCCTSTINQPPQPHSLNAHLSSRNDRPEQQRCSRLATMSSFRPHLRHRACCCSQNRNPKLVSCRHRSFRFLKRRKCHQHHRNFQCRTWTCHQIRSKATTAKVRRRQPKGQPKKLANRLVSTLVRTIAGYASSMLSGNGETGQIDSTVLVGPTICRSNAQLANHLLPPLTSVDWRLALSRG